MNNVIDIETSHKITLALQRQMPFFYVAYPGEGSGRLWVQFDDNAAIADEDCLSMTLAPFDTSRHLTLTVIGRRASVEEIASVAIPNRYIDETVTRSTDRMCYLSGVRHVIDTLQQMPAGSKAVISRVISLESSRSVAQVANRVFGEFPESFRYIWYHPDTGLWTGATPELLLDASDPQRLVSMSLAGTRRASDCGEWDTKNRGEHDAVTRFICETFNAFCHECRVGDDCDLQYGEIAHLCTPVYGIGPDPAKIDCIFERLSPTPAVSGYPRNCALEIIDSVESHDRRYYAGYLRIGNRAWVNLRCARVVCRNNKYIYTIYSGGGITADSDPEAEWAEAQSKSRPLVNAVIGPDDIAVSKIQESTISNH